MIYSVDWSHDAGNLAVYDGKKSSKKLPEPSDGITIVTENMPLRQAKPYLDAGAQVWCCNTTESARCRRLAGLEKTHEKDAKILYLLYQRYPEKFRRMSYDPIFSEFRSLYMLFKDIQNVRVAVGNRLYANENSLVREFLTRLESQETDIVKQLRRQLKTMPVFTEFLDPIKGVGPAVSSGLLSLVGDFDRFPRVSSMWKYFGLDVRDGKAPRRKKGEVANWSQAGRSLLLGVLADSFVKHRTPIYRDIYDREKAKQLPLVERPIIAERRARRKAVKEFIKDFFQAYKKYGREAKKTAA